MASLQDHSRRGRHRCRAEGSTERRESARRIGRATSSSNRRWTSPATGSRCTGGSERRSRRRHRQRGELLLGGDASRSPEAPAGLRSRGSALQPAALLRRRGAQGSRSCSRGLRVTLAARMRSSGISGNATDSEPCFECDQLYPIMVHFGSRWFCRLHAWLRGIVNEEGIPSRKVHPDKRSPRAVAFRRARKVRAEAARRQRGGAA